MDRCVFISLTFNLVVRFVGFVLSSETLTMDTFNFIMKHVFSTFESLSIEKQAAARPWSKRCGLLIPGAFCMTCTH